MEKIIKQLKNAGKNTRLSPAEKTAMKSTLMQYVKAHPVGGIYRTFSMATISPFSIQNFRNKKGISILVIGGLLMSGSVSFAAENAVPGDVLYPVKVNVNERLRGAAAITPKAKADWDVRLVERRLQEVEKLTTNPDVHPEVRKLAEDNLEHYAERVKARIAKFEEDEDSDDAIETASNLSDMLTAHEQVLYDLGTGVNSVGMATTTPTIVAPVKDEDSANDTLRKVRGARDDAEKKHKELKKKYFKNEDDMLDEDATVAPLLQSVPPSIRIGDREEVTKVRIKRIREEKREKREELRETPSLDIMTPLDVATSTVSADVPISVGDGENKEYKKTEDND